MKSLRIQYLLFLMKQLPQKSTLFPYTTLFRSVRPPRPPHLEAGMSADAARRFGRNRLALIDRKSTRLNSSHPSRSYAVFCLKKKILLSEFLLFLLILGYIF